MKSGWLGYPNDYIQALWKEALSTLTSTPESDRVLLQSSWIPLQSHNTSAESERSGITKTFSIQFRETTAKQYFLKECAQNIENKQNSSRIMVQSKFNSKYLETALEQVVYTLPTTLSISSPSTSKHYKVKTPLFSLIFFSQEKRHIFIYRFWLASSCKYPHLAVNL